MLRLFEKWISNIAQKTEKLCASVAASHSEYHIYLINIAPIYDKKQPKNLEIMLCFQFLLRRLITSMMLLPTIVYYYKKHTLPRMLKYFQVIKISKKNQVSPNHFFYLLLIFKDIFKLYLCFVSIVKVVFCRKAWLLIIIYVGICFEIWIKHWASEVTLEVSVELFSNKLVFYSNLSAFM